jgi:hypothetical protein
MELYTSKIKFDSELLLKEIKGQYDTSSISEHTPTVTMHNLDKNYQLPKLKTFNELVLPVFDGLEIDNIFLFFTHPSGKLDWHKDGGHEYRRFIFPIVSNENCINWFKIDEVEYSTRFEDGRIQWFDSQMIEHNVVNTGDTIRVAYLLDMKWDSVNMKKVLENSFDMHNLFTES